MPDSQPPTPSDDIRTRMQSRPPGPAEPTPHPRADIALTPPPNPSRRLGHYQLSEALGEGGMGTVWLAEDEQLHRKAAVKVMKPEYARDPVARERFTREARAMAAVRSDHVVTVYGVGEQDGVPYLAMELLPGKPLDKWLERHPQPKIAAVVQIGREAAQGLAAAHAKGLIHRDVKPSNLWLEAPTGRVKVLDFGLARSTQDDARLTATGQPYGTPAYMSPEQARGEKLDHRSDLFSLGVVLYELAAGRHPFPGDSPFTVMSAICNDEPASVRELSPLVPEALAALIHRMLAKKSEDRPASAEEVATALRSVKGGSEAATARPRPAVAPAQPASCSPGPAPVARPAASSATRPPEPRAIPPAVPRSRTQHRGRSWAAIGVAAGLLALVAVAITIAVAVGEMTRGPRPEQSSKSGTPVAIADPKIVERQPMTKVDVVPPVPPPAVVPPPAPKAVVVPVAPPPMPSPPVVAPAPPPGVPEPMPQPPSEDPPTITLDLGGGITMEFVRIPAGEFLMGSPKGEAQRGDDEGEHSVRISRAFYLGKYPVTQEQYRAVTGANPSYFCASGGRKDKVQGLDTRRFPVETVSWDDAVAFCEKLSRPGKKVTLPTEAEWEYAARGGTRTAFYFGDALNGTQANCDGTRPFGTTAKGTYLARTSLVGSYEKNYPHPWGLADMHGNVKQWCRDWYDAGYYKRSPNVDPFCDDGEQRYRVLRGGSWHDDPRHCRCACRHRSKAATQFYFSSNGDYFIGFRVSFRLD